MNNGQDTQNPDVNSPDPDSDPARHDRSDSYRREDEDDGDESIPVPPDVEQPYPVKDPPVGNDAPVGDVDDSPKRIAGE